MGGGSNPLREVADTSFSVAALRPRLCEGFLDSIVLQIAKAEARDLRARQRLETAPAPFFAVQYSSTCKTMY